MVYNITRWLARYRITRSLARLGENQNPALESDLSKPNPRPPFQIFRHEFFGAFRSNFSGFTRLCKGLAVVIVGGHVVVQFFPSAVAYLALIPARKGKLSVMHDALDMQDGGQHSWSSFLGKLLEPIWGTREFLKFIFVVNFLTSVCVFITAIALYYITRQENYLYMPLSGFHGVLSGFLVGIKQIIPDQELSLFSLLKIRARWLPSLMLLLSIAISFFTTESAAYLPALIFGTYMGWIYLRYLQRKPETRLKGDPSDEFAFSTFFPEFLRPVIDPIGSVFGRLCCGRFEISDEDRGHTLGGAPLPGSDPIEASRRRERGARALEERLAVERLTAGESAKESGRDAVEDV
ncbi:Rhomboid-like protein 19 [Vitis vinifera]|uniref:Rhomboid-like protein 19 n=1 Tax=Vitis vinifera TaxID=29760 RepID=A0A438D9M4_VITVI|nr:Rhomboid-like protein 19 [Vitis vinifera]